MKSVVVIMTSSFLLILGGCSTLPVYSPTIEPSEQELLSGQVVSYRISPEERGGYAYKSVFYIDMPLQTVWEVMKDVEEYPHEIIRSHQIISISDNKAITKDEYNSSPGTFYTWQTTFDERNKKITYNLVNLDSFQFAGEKVSFNYGTKQLYEFGNRTKFVQHGYLKSRYASSWINSGDYWGMKRQMNVWADFYRHQAKLASSVTTNMLSEPTEAPVKLLTRDKRHPNQAFAVVVGISEYSNIGQGGLDNLIYADNDARVFANALKKQGWSADHIKLLTNKQATQRNITIALESWLTKAGPKDLVVLFWSGHGFPDPEDPEKVYFACYDTDIRIPATGYRMDQVHRILRERRCRNVVVMADTCHAGKLITRGDEKGVSIRPFVEKIKRKNNIPKGWIFMVGADVDRKAIEHSSWSHGAFTHCLLEALSGKADGYESVGLLDGIVTMGELRSYMNSVMPEKTQQILGVAKRPIITTSTGDPDIWNLTLQRK